VSRLGDPLNGVAAEEPGVPVVDRLDVEIGLVPGPLQVVLAVDLLEEDLRLPPVFVEIPDDRFLIDVPAGAAQAKLGAARARSG
jgi:hypothetical protein